jgi:hypothetical protein
VDCPALPGTQEGNIAPFNLRDGVAATSGRQPPAEHDSAVARPDELVVRLLVMIL